jgi:transcriptional regulator with XRE-family HTH domain
MKVVRPVELATFGARLRALRRAKGLSQAELARLIGRHQSVIGPYERDEYMPTRPILERLAAALDSSPEYLLFGRSPARSRLALAGRVGSGGLLVDVTEEDQPLLALREESLALWRVVDDSMAPVYRPGDYLVAEVLELAPQMLEFGREALVQLADGRVLLRRLFPGAQPGRFDLAAWNAPTLAGVEVRLIRRVVGSLRREAFHA